MTEQKTIWKKILRWTVYITAGIYYVYWDLAQFVFRDWYMSASLDALFFVFWALTFLVSEKIGKPTKYWLAAYMLAVAVIKVIFAWYF